MIAWQRGSGLVAHPTSFSGPFGIGDLGPGCIALLDFLAASKQRYWQVLPLNPTGYGNSPYAALSAFAGNPLIISPERLQEDGLLTQSELADRPLFPADHVDYGLVIRWKTKLLHLSYERFTAEKAVHTLSEEFAVFCQKQSDWLDDYALFAALKDVHHGSAWIEWDAELAAREPATLAEAQQQLHVELAFQRYLQFIFARQWDTVRQEAKARKIAIIGDLPIFVAHDSADVWAHRELFHLDAQGKPTVVAGVPPDYFSETGQLWGNPLYRWEVLRERGYPWWIARVRRALELVDIIRLDHFRGFQAYWEIPGDAETASKGRWAPGPGEKLFIAIENALGEVPLIAEDLGEITPEVHALRQRLGFPGMRVLQFAFSTDASSPHLPHNYMPENVVYTGTHDNDTTVGWLRTCSEDERRHMLRYLRVPAVADEAVAWEAIRAVLASVAMTAIIPLQDALTLGSEARMNVPSRASDNWEWRYVHEQLTPAVSQRLAEMCLLYGRS